MPIALPRRTQHRESDPASLSSSTDGEPSMAKFLKGSSYRPIIKSFSLPFPTRPTFGEKFALEQAFDVQGKVGIAYGPGYPERHERSRSSFLKQLIEDPQEGRLPARSKLRKRSLKAQ